MLLHVSATPEFLPRREQERTKISSILGDAILSQSGTCLCKSCSLMSFIYLNKSLTPLFVVIAGVPGTGKTATVHSVVRELQQDEVSLKYRFFSQIS